VFLHQISASSLLYHIKSSLHGTIDGGAALAFLVAGPVTAMPTMILFWTIFKKRVFVLYMVVCITGSILIAYTFQFLVFVPGMDTGNPLLSGVSALSGGGSAVIEKLDQHVRIVADPGGKNIIATYNNDVEGHGGVVFETSAGRFLDSSAGSYDNSLYIRNVADWLEQGNISPARENILVYNTFYEVGLENHAFGCIPENLRSHGFQVKILDRRKAPELTDALLASYGQVWVVFGEEGAGRQLADDELEVLAGFVAEGKSMLIVAGSPRPDMAELSAENRLSSRYGVRFAGYTENPAELPVGAGARILGKMSGLLGEALRLVNKA
jgi:hypothetical protein